MGNTVGVAAGATVGTDRTAPGAVTTGVGLGTTLLGTTLLGAGLLDVTLRGDAANGAELVDGTVAGAALVHPATATAISSAAAPPRAADRRPVIPPS